MDLHAKQQLNRGFGDALARGFEFVGTVLVLFLLGWALDAWLGTTPLFMVGLTTLGVIGKLIGAWYVYDAEMKRHEAQLPKANRT